MKSLTESPAVLTVHLGTAGQYILRVADLRYRPLVIGVTKLLSDAESFVVITPSDIKVFAVNGTGSKPVEEEVSVDIETQAAIDAEESRSVPGEEVEQETPKPVKRRGRPPKEQAGHDETCQRCGGTGKTQIILDGGKGAEAACPICKGQGIMRRYGARR